jgi:2-polyprenyl-3-methyl-5-hydroxy-6-metoxy-1,4-benzoquinol methylase
MAAQRLTALNSGERQVAPSLLGIRRDHVARYEWAAKRLPAGSVVVDLACGVGYGTQLLAQHGHKVLGLDIDAEALDYAREHYAHPLATYRRGEAEFPPNLGPLTAVVSFETVEHVADPRPMLLCFRESATLLLASVPNESVFPYTGQKFHFRHYTKAQFEALLNECGWRVTEWHTQAAVDGKEAAVKRGDDGWTLIAVCKHGALPDDGMCSMGFGE